MYKRQDEALVQVIVLYDAFGVLLIYEVSHLQEEIAHVVEAVRQRRVAGLGSFFGDDDVGAPYYERLHLFALEKIHHVGVYH